MEYLVMTPETLKSLITEVMKGGDEDFKKPPLVLKPGETYEFHFTFTWDGENHRDLEIGETKR